MEQAHQYDREMRGASRSYFIREDVLFPSHAPVSLIFYARNTRAYIQLVRMTPDLFDYLLGHMDQDWLARHDGFADADRMDLRSGRPNMLSGRQALALVLSWYGSTTQTRLLELVFGVGHTIFSRTLREGRTLLLHAKRNA